MNPLSLFRTRERSLSGGQFSVRVFDGAEQQWMYYAVTSFGPIFKPPLSTPTAEQHAAIEAVLAAALDHWRSRKIVKQEE